METPNRCLAPLLALAALIGLASAATKQAAPLTCVDDDGNPVDWAIVYKFPTLRKQPAPFNSGWAYASLTSDDVRAAGGGRRTRASRAPSADLNWDVSPKLLTDPDSLVKLTLEPVFGSRSGSASLSSVFYSDQPPTGPKPGPGRGHAKGVLLMDDQTATGLWLVHTVPRFPAPRLEPLAFQSNSRIYAQTFMCISFDLNQAGQQIVEHLINLRPHVYDAHIGANIRAAWPQTSRLEVGALKGVRLQGVGSARLAQVVASRGGERLALFSQSGEGETDMFGWLNQELRASLYVESWRNGVGALDSSCPSNSFHVNNVLGLQVEVAGGGRLEWSSSQDHSKWAISDSAQTGYVCLSDINRMASQFRRGGGSVCMRCAGCWHLFSKSIVEVEPCDLNGGRPAGEADSAYDSGDEEDGPEEMEAD